MAALSFGHTDQFGQAGLEQAAIAGKPQTTLIVGKNLRHVIIKEPLRATNAGVAAFLPATDAVAGIADPEASIGSRVQTAHGQCASGVLGPGLIYRLIAHNFQNLAVRSSSPDRSVKTLHESADGPSSLGHLQSMNRAILHRMQTAGGVGGNPDFAIFSRQ